MFIETERTPNPATLMFRPGRSVTDGTTADFATPEAAAASPLATALFGLGDVERVFFGAEFISVTKAEGVGRLGGIENPGARRARRSFQRGSAAVLGGRRDACHQR